MSEAEARSQKPDDRRLPAALPPQAYAGTLTCWPLAGRVAVGIRSDLSGLHIELPIGAVEDHIRHLQRCLEVARRT